MLKNNKQPMNHKSKGSNAERELLHMFWQHNWACIRSAGSGSMQHDSPDLIAGCKERKLCIECKATKSKYQYFTKEEIFALRSFSHLFGSEAYVGIKFNNQPWVFLKAHELHETEKNYAVSREFAKEQGLSFEKLIEKMKRF
jgi:Holliday junction resolvase